MGTSSPIDWQPAHAGHRYALQQFVCATPAKELYDGHRGKHHPAPWQLEVQSHLRGLRPVLREGEALLLGLEGKAVIAASHFGFDSEGVTLMIYALGRHVECAGQGVGRALLGRTLEALHVTKVEEKLETPVLTRIWEGNTTSQRLFADAGFERIEETSKSGLFLWGHPLKA